MKVIADFEDLESTRCPVCGSPLIDELDSDDNQGDIVIDMYCKECKSTWSILYKGEELCAFINITDFGGDVLEEWVE